MSEVWSLPGYDVQVLLGYGRSGEVWRAVERATGEPVAVRRLGPDVAPAAVAALRRDAPTVQALDTPYVVRLRAVVDEGDERVLVHDLAPGGSLAALLGRRGHLDPAEVVTLVAPLAHALATAHAQGLVHGDVTPASVLFSSEGMPLLADLGLTRCTGAQDDPSGCVAPEVAAGAQSSSAADVWALGAVAHQCLAGGAPRALGEVVDRARAADPAQRPTARELAVALRRAHTAAPIRLLGDAARDSTPPAVPAGPPITSAVPSASWRPPPRALALLAAAALLVVAGAGGWLWGRSGSPEAAVLADALPSAAPTRVPAAPEPDWPAVLARLDGLRAGALAAADAIALQQLYATGSPALAADLAAVRALQRADERARGVRHTIRSVQALWVDARSARLRVVDTLAAYDVTDADGQLLRRVPGRAEAAFVVTLRRTVGGWRLDRITPA